jgi:hypothetical protein
MSPDSYFAAYGNSTAHASVLNAAYSSRTVTSSGHGKVSGYTPTNLGAGKPAPGVACIFYDCYPMPPALTKGLNVVSDVLGQAAFGFHAGALAGLLACFFGPEACVAGLAVTKAVSNAGDVLDWMSVGAYCIGNGSNGRCQGGVLYSVGLAASFALAPPPIGAAGGAIGDLIWQAGG